MVTTQSTWGESKIKFKMGREEKLEGITREVSVITCWLCYIFALLSQFLVFKFPVDEDAFMNGFYAHIISTVVIFAFSFVCGNSSLYDPAWYTLPVGIALGWTMTAKGEVLIRQVITYFLVCLWASRFVI